MPSSSAMRHHNQNTPGTPVRDTRIPQSYADHPAPIVMARTDYLEKAAEHHEQAAVKYRYALGHYNYGDYQQAQEHAKAAKNHALEADRYSALAAEIS